MVLFPLGWFMQAYSVWLLARVRFCHSTIIKFSLGMLEVDDFDKTIEHLRHHNVQFALEPFDLPYCRAAIIMDPDGNKLGIHKRNA